MKKQTIIATLAVAFGVITAPLVATTGYTARLVAAPDAKAISVLKAAFKLITPANPKTAWIHAEGKLLWNNQGFNPQQSTRTRRLSADWKVDFTNHRLLQRNASYVGKDLMWCDERVTSR